MWKKNYLKLCVIFCFVSCFFVLPSQATEYAPNGKSYLEQTSNGKSLMHLEGSPYEIGYAMGYLHPESVFKMCSNEYLLGMIAYFTPLKFNHIKQFDFIITIAKKVLKNICRGHKRFIPQEYIEEMEGIAAGATDRGYPVSFDDVLFLNTGIDAMASIYYPLLVPFRKVIEAPHSCNGFVAFGNATENSNVYMGRDLMYSAVIFSDYATLIEFVPENGKHFVSIAPPGFVGVFTGMNSHGIGIGMNLVFGVDVNPIDTGMGSLFLARQVAQYSDSLESAKNILRKAVKGVLWNYVIGDAAGKGAVIEASAKTFSVRDSNWKLPHDLKYIEIHEQIEGKNDLVVATNHYIRPLTFLQAGSFTIDDSIWRYKTLTGLLLDNYGNINGENGKKIIDFLHPPNYGYRSDDPDKAVDGSVTLFDLTNREVWSLFGKYSDSWAHFKLK